MKLVDKAADLAMPAGLSDAGRRAYEELLSVEEIQRVDDAITACLNEDNEDNE